MKRYTRNLFFGSLLCSIALISCDDAFLDEKPDKALLVPTTLADFQALLDNDTDQALNYSPGLNVVAADNFYRTTPNVLSLRTIERNTHMWASNLFEGASVDDWNKPYRAVFYANIVLDGLDKLPENSGSSQTRAAIRGSALFFRARAFYDLAQQFAAQYNKLTASSKPGIPIRLTSDVNKLVPRGTLQQTYDQIITDLTEAENLLPIQVVGKTRPSNAAAQGMLARIYLQMSDYTNAELFANKFLSMNNKLIDFNTLNPSAARPLPSGLQKGNDEVVFYSRLLAMNFTGASSATIVDSSLYASYKTNDLRRTCFFINRGNGVVNFKGSYTGSSSLFNGVAVDEVYLIRSECRARNNDVQGALEDLNALLITRWKKGTFVPLTASSQKEVLKLILDERRKELIARGLRWGDLRRLNNDPEYVVTLSRIVDGKTYILSPNDPKYVFPIPDNEILLSGIEQNDR